MESKGSSALVLKTFLSTLDSVPAEYTQILNSIVTISHKHPSSAVTELIAYSLAHSHNLEVILDLCSVIIQTIREHLHAFLTLPVDCLNNLIMDMSQLFSNVPYVNLLMGFTRMLSVLTQSFNSDRINFFVERLAFDPIHVIMGSCFLPTSELLSYLSRAVDVLVHSEIKETSVFAICCAIRTLRCYFSQIHRSALLQTFNLFLGSLNLFSKYEQTEHFLSTTICSILDLLSIESVKSLWSTQKQVLMDLFLHSNEAAFLNANRFMLRLINSAEWTEQETIANWTSLLPVITQTYISKTPVRETEHTLLAKEFIFKGIQINQATTTATILKMTQSNQGIFCLSLLFVLGSNHLSSDQFQSVENHFFELLKKARDTSILPLLTAIEYIASQIILSKEQFERFCKFIVLDNKRTKYTDKRRSVLQTIVPSPSVDKSYQFKLLAKLFVDPTAYKMRSTLCLLLCRFDPPPLKYQLFPFVAMLLIELHQDSSETIITLLSKLEYGKFIDFLQPNPTACIAKRYETPYAGQMLYRIFETVCSIKTTPLIDICSALELMACTIACIDDNTLISSLTNLINGVIEKDADLTKSFSFLFDCLASERLNAAITIVSNIRSDKLYMLSVSMICEHGPINQLMADRFTKCIKRFIESGVYECLPWAVSFIKGAKSDLDQFFLNIKPNVEDDFQLLSLLQCYGYSTLNVPFNESNLQILLDLNIFTKANTSHSFLDALAFCFGSLGQVTNNTTDVILVLFKTIHFCEFMNVVLHVLIAFLKSIPETLRERFEQDLDDTEYHRPFIRIISLILLRTVTKPYLPSLEFLRELRSLSYPVDDFQFDSIESFLYCFKISDVELMGIYLLNEYKQADEGFSQICFIVASFLSKQGEPFPQFIETLVTVHFLSNSLFQCLVAVKSSLPNLIVSIMRVPLQSASDLLPKIVDHDPEQEKHIFDEVCSLLRSAQSDLAALNCLAFINRMFYRGVFQSWLGDNSLPFFVSIFTAFVNHDSNAIRELCTNIVNAFCGRSEFYVADQNVPKAFAHSISFVQLDYLLSLMGFIKSEESIFTQKYQVALTLSFLIPLCEEEIIDSVVDIFVIFLQDRKVAQNVSNLLLDLQITKVNQATVLFDCVLFQFDVLDTLTATSIITYLVEYAEIDDVNQLFTAIKKCIGNSDVRIKMEGLKLVEQVRNKIDPRELINDAELLGLILLESSDSQSQISGQAMDVLCSTFNTDPSNSQIIFDVVVGAAGVAKVVEILQLCFIWVEIPKLKQGSLELIMNLTEVVCKNPEAKGAIKDLVSRSLPSAQQPKKNICIQMLPFLL